MIVEKAQDLLKKLERINDRQVLDVGLDSVSEMIIRVITNECKSTNLDIYGHTKIRRYGSDIIKENLYTIVRILILNGENIPKEVMRRIMYSKGMILGLNSELSLDKVIQEKEDGTIERTVVIETPLIDFSTLTANTIKCMERKVYDKLARQFILSNNKELPKISSFSILKEKLLHRKEQRQTISDEFIEILKTQTSYNDEIIKRTVQYQLDNMYNPIIEKEILSSISKETTLLPLESKRKTILFRQLKETISAEIQDILKTQCNIMNQFSEDISQVYADIQAQLTAYSTDLTQLDAFQIESKIKQIGKRSIKESKLQKYINKSGYRNVNAVIIGKDVQLVDRNNILMCMRKLSKDIEELVQSADTMDKENYLKRAVQLSYRFIRIHPFPDSNGRTSRAILNMMTIPKGILVEVSKEKKAEFVQSQRDTNEKLDIQGYFEILNKNTEELDKIERENLDLPMYHFIRQNCILDVQSQQQEGEESVKKQPEKQKDLENR